MASNNTSTKQAPTLTVEVDDRVANYIAQKDNPTPSEAAVLAVHQSNMAAAAAAAATTTTTTARPGEANARGPGSGPGAWPSSTSDVASRLASSGFTDLGTDTRWSTLEPAVRDRLERNMLLFEDQWRENPFKFGHQQEKEDLQSFHRPLHRHYEQQQQQNQQQQYTAQDNQFGLPPPFSIQPQGQHRHRQTAAATLRTRQGDQTNGASCSTTQARVKELLASQRKHLLAAVEIDHQLREIWLEQQASSDGNKVDGA